MQEVEQRRSSCRGNGTSQRMIHRHFIVGIHALCGEVAVAGIAHQQALAFQVTANPLGDGTGQLGEFTIGWRFNPAKPCGLVITANVHAVQKEHVEVEPTSIPHRTRRPSQRA